MPGSFVIMTHWRSRFVSGWYFMYRLVLFLTIIGFAMNWQRILLHIRLPPSGSLFRHFGWMFAAFVLILLMVSATHEVGHLVAGYFARLQFYLLVIGPLRFSRENGDFQMSLQRGMGFFNGMVASIPKDIIKLRQRMLLFAFGGPAASLLLTGVSLFIASIFGKDGRFSYTPAWIWESAFFMAITSFLFFLTSMKPGAYQNGYMADGGRIASLLKADANTESWCALVVVNAAELQGVRPREWDADQVAIAVQLQEQSYDSLMAQLVGYQWEIDHGRFAAADSYLETALKNRSIGMPNLYMRILLEKAYLLAWAEHNPESARTWLAQVKYNGRYQSASFHRVEAAIQLADGHPKEAIKEVNKGLAVLKKANATGIMIAEADWLYAILKSAQNDQTD